MKVPTLPSTYSISSLEAYIANVGLFLSIHIERERDIFKNVMVYSTKWVL